MSVGFRERGLIPRTMSLEKMKPGENRRHKELINGFLVHLSRYVGELVDAIKARKAEPVAHWSELQRGEVLKGMNSTEVILALGRPTSVRKSGARVKWMYGNNRVVVFTDGVVTTVI